MNRTEQLRQLPSVDEVLRHETVANLRQEASHVLVTQWARDAIDDCRQRLLDGAAIESEMLLKWVVDQVSRRWQRDSSQVIQRVINATGVVLHTNLGRSPLANRAIERAAEAARYANVELDLETGRRCKRGDRVTKLLAQLTGAEDALVVNNCAAATMLVLQSIALGRKVIVSRGQLVEIGGGFRLPDVFRCAGVELCEVGTTNRTYLSDYENAIDEQTGAILRVHRSNFHLSGFVTEPTIAEMVAIQRAEEIPVIDDLGSGCITNLSPFGLDEPTVLESVRSGAELTLFSGDKLFGGPQAGIVVGKREWIDRLRTSPMMRAMRVDKVTLAALEATTEIHLAGNAHDELPTLRMLVADPDDIRGRCNRLLAEIADRCDGEVIACESQVGGGSVPGSSLQSFGVQIDVDQPDRLASFLRSGPFAVQARVTDECLLLDLRTVDEDELEPLLAALIFAFDAYAAQKDHA